MNLLQERDPARTADLHDPDVNDAQRRIANVIRVGVVSDADYQRARVRVAIGKLKTDWLPWLAHRAGADVTWWAPEINEQVVVFSPCGNLGQGLVLGAIYQNAFPAPQSRETIHYTRYQDGTEVSYDRAAHKLSVNCAGEVDVQAATAVNVMAETVTVNCSGQAKVNASSVQIGNPTTVDGRIFLQHTHSGVQAGGSVTGPVV